MFQPTPSSPSRTYTIYQCFHLISRLCTWNRCYRSSGRLCLCNWGINVQKKYYCIIYHYHSAIDSCALPFSHWQFWNTHQLLYWLLTLPAMFTCFPLDKMLLYWVLPDSIALVPAIVETSPQFTILLAKMDQAAIYNYWCTLWRQSNISEQSLSNQ